MAKDQACAQGGAKCPAGGPAISFFFFFFLHFTFSKINMTSALRI